MRTPRIVVLCLFAAANTYALPAVLSLKLPTGSKPTAIETGAQGDVYIAGSIWSPYPNAAITDSFVARYNPSSDSLVYFTKFGAAAHFAQNSLALDATGNAYLIGDTQTTSFLPTGSTPPSSGTPVAIALKIGPAGQVVYSMQIAGSSKSGAIAVNASGEAYITGSTDGTTILSSTAGAAVSKSNPAFVAKLDAAGTHLLWVNRGVGGVAIALDAQENVYASGSFFLMDPADPVAPPVTPGTLPLQTKFVSCSVSFLSSFPCSHQHIAKLDSSGTKLIYGLYLTGQYGARPSSMAVDAQGDLYLTGYTASSDYPVTAGAVDPTFLQVVNTAIPSASESPRLTVFEAPAEIGFVTELNPDASAVVFSTYLGSTPPTPTNTNIVTGVLTRDSVTKLRLYKNQIYVAGITNGTGFTGLSDVPKSCIPATFLLRVANDGRSVDQFHSAAIPNAANTVADARSYALTSSVAFDAQGQAYQIGPFDGAYRFDPTILDLPSSCVTDASTYQVTSTIAPGQLLSVFGTTLGSTAAAATATAGLLPTTLGTTTADFDGIPARLLYASPQQVNVMVPYEIAGRAQITMNIRTTSAGAGTIQSTASLNVAARNPAAFVPYVPSTTCGEVDDALVRLPDGTFNSCTNAATGGSIVSIFINGAGVPGFTPASGQIATQATQVNVPVATTFTLGSSTTGTLDVVNFSLEPGSVSGVWRLDLRAPTSPSGTSFVQFTVTIDGVPLENRLLVMYVKP